EAEQLLGARGGADIRLGKQADEACSLDVEADRVGVKVNPMHQGGQQLMLALRWAILQRVGRRCRISDDSPQAVWRYGIQMQRLDDSQLVAQEVSDRLQYDALQLSCRQAPAADGPGDCVHQSFRDVVPIAPAPLVGVCRTQ